MKTYKNLMNSLSDDDLLRQMTEEEIKELRSVFLQTYLDLADCCKRNGLTVMLLGGSCLGAVRHKGYIPWDDDLDVAMTRKDFERLKEIFDKEMGDKYILSSPNYKGNARNRFPMILVKDTVMVETGENPEEDLNKIKIDMFLLENIPENPVHRAIKGLWCTALMFITSYEETYEKCDEYMRRYMCKTPEGEREFKRRMIIGRLFSFNKFQKWADRVDKAFQYPKETKLLGIPSGRKHYFGEILPREAYVPVSKGEFEGRVVDLPGNTDQYLSNLYGDDYMTPPPVEKRERHMIMEVEFGPKK